MEKTTITTIDCQNMQIAASVEAHVVEPHSIYYPSNVLFYVQRGQLNLEVNQKLHTIKKGAFALIRKYTHGQCFKTWGENEGSAKMIAFILQDEFLQKVIEKVGVKPTKLAPVEQIVDLPYNVLLKGLMDSIWTYIEGNLQLDRSMVELKTMEALLAVTQSRPDLVPILKDYTRVERADLENFVRHNFMYNISLEKLAKMSGRSLSTFNRDFKALFQKPPHQWIKQQRLELARSLLLQTHKMPSDVYLEVGFEDLAHFSRSFKKYFGENPSEIKKMAH
ncbi:helix-turn-helix domain-containing protein [Aureispira anguillae]|uniref:AraC family transcriptional regulator n=1 Tax=Aureispira anguillae TaxID=2864201 RepID=A0A915YH32_9BACT|nr:AraC family transcriptional regulator [Aureispira anguillae]BDS12907.1 AraC family transcriptional regulator [Aureispira anguillae]